MEKHVRIENISSAALETAALGGSISTQKGTTSDLFDKKISNDIDKNESLIEKVVSSGHMSILEHITFSLLLTNVSVCVEEFFIEHRLASFTVKSRRYVDFANAGFYIPNEFKEDDRLGEIYENNMTDLFNSYGKLIELGVPKEDARFLLPYSFHDNFVCTVNAREAIHIVEDLYNTGRQQAHMVGREIEECENEYLNLYIEIMVELKLKLPVIHDILAERIKKIHLEFIEDTVPFVRDNDVKFVSYTDDLDALVRARSIACEAYGSSVRQQDRGTVHTNLSVPTSVRLKINSGNYGIYDNPRIYEFINCYIDIQDISLPTLTHFVRHRMQSIIVPRLDQITSNSFIIPNSIITNKEALGIYMNAINDNDTVIHCIDADIIRLPWVRQYFLLSANTVDISTCMNARELKIFMQLRTCNRAYWETKYFADEILRQLRLSDPLFREFGPSCFVSGRCPEGKLCCGKQKDVYDRYYDRVLDV